MTTTVAITIGHDGQPGYSYRALTLDALRTLESVGATILCQGTGTGYWEGQEEGTTFLLATVPEWDDLDYLRQRLARLAGIHRQDAIGLTIHDHRTYGASYVLATTEQETI